jgi:glycerol uptake facilitator-like aquaporin
MSISLIKPAFAQIINPAIKGSDAISKDPSNYVNNVIQAIISIFLLVAVVYFIWHIVMAAYHLIASNGDPKKYEESQRAIINAAVGLIIVFAIFAILKFAGAVLGVPGLENLTLTWPSLSK